MTLSITTNNQSRELLYLCDFSEAEQKQIRSDYDWMEPEDIECNFGFFRYRSRAGMVTTAIAISVVF